ncbi:hypothetical protein D1007_60994 [Hordeum vulgare]|nr:hypothetical protein D1007_60994 [Hordeum vulgare]
MARTTASSGSESGDAVQRGTSPSSIGSIFLSPSTSPPRWTHTSPAEPPGTPAVTIGYYFTSRRVSRDTGIRPPPAATRWRATPSRCPSGWSTHRESPTSPSTATGGPNKDFHDEPYILCAEAALVLFSVTFVPIPGRRSIQHFVYRAGPGPPSLDLIPDPDRIRIGDQFGLLPCGDSEHYAVVFLNTKFAYNKPCRFDLHIFSSVTWACSKVPSSCLSEDDQALLLNHGTCKSVMVGDSSLGWVGLFSGIVLLCDVFGECPVVKYITLPASRIRQTDERGLPYFASEYCCDVSSCRDDGLIKFVEIEFDEPERRRGNQGWRAIIWDRIITSDGWNQRFTVDAANISVDPSYSDLLPELWNSKTGEPELKRLIFYTPTPH